MTWVHREILNGGQSCDGRRIPPSRRLDFAASQVGRGTTRTIGGLPSRTWENKGKHLTDWLLIKNSARWEEQEDAAPKQTVTWPCGWGTRTRPSTAEFRKPILEPLPIPAVSPSATLGCISTFSDRPPVAGHGARCAAVCPTDFSVYAVKWRLVLVQLILVLLTERNRPFVK